MSYSPAVSVLLTCAFTLTGLGELVRSVLSVGAIDRTSTILHVVMSFAMLSMPYAWGLAVFPAVAQIVVFAAAAVFYLAVLLVRPTSVAGPTGGHHSRPGLLGYHAYMMASMVVMGIMMLGMGGMGPGSGQMAMAMSAPRWEAVTGIVLGIVFALAGLWFLLDLVRGIRGGPDRRHVFDTVISLLMAAGMAVAFIAI